MPCELRKTNTSRSPPNQGLRPSAPASQAVASGEGHQERQTSGVEEMLKTGPQGGVVSVTSEATTGTANRFALFLESCAPVANSLNFGSPLLFGPASLQLAQIKTQLALHQLNAIATGGCANAPALSLLNLLKATMSHPLYNPRGAPFSGQRPMVSGQYGLNAQQAMEMAAVRLGPAGIMPQVLSQQMGFPMAQRPTALSQDMESAIDMHIRGAREEVRLLNQIMHQQKLADPRLRKEPHDEVLAQGSAFPPRVPGGRPEEQSAVDWSSYQTPSKLFAPQVMAQPSSAGQMFQPSGYGSPTRGGRGSVSGQPSAAPGDHRPPRYTSESASSILASFGLSNEDLELLSHYPDEQLTPENLPFILRDMRVRKAKQNLPEAERMGGEPRQSNVIDYGHSSKYDYAEKSPVGFQLDQLAKGSAKFSREVPVCGSPFPLAEPAHPQPSGGPGQKKPTMDQRKQLPGANPKTGPTRDSGLPASVRSVAPPPGHGARAGMRDLADGGAGGLKPGYPAAKTAWPPAFPPGGGSAGKRLPTPTMMNDYSAASPRIFPHTCSLCNVECVQIKDWIEHQNTSRHIESCRHLRKQYPDWNVETVAVSRNESKTSLDRRSPKRRTNSPSRSQSWSRSPSPRRYRGRSGSRGRRPRSRSPRRYRRVSPSHSRSPRRAPRRHSPRRSRSRSYTRRSPARGPRRVSPRRQRRSASSERLAKKLIQSSGLSVTDSTTLESVMQSLAPALMAELAKRKGGSSSASAKCASKKPSSSPTSSVSKKGEKPISSTTKSSSLSALKGVASAKSGSSSKNVRVKRKTAPGTACLLRLKGIPFSTTPQDLTEAVEPFGKVNNAILLKAIQEASVCMEREEDAQALVSCKDLMIRGKVVSICMEKDTAKETRKSVCAKKKEVSSAKTPVSSKPKAPTKSSETNVVKKVVKKEVLKCVVQISGLPESGYTEEDLTKLAVPYALATEVVIVGIQRKAFLELPDAESAEAMVKAYKDLPAKIQDSELSIVKMTKPIDLASSESLFRELMGAGKPEEDSGLGERLLTVHNVPSGASGVTETQELIKRFGTVKQSLLLNHKIVMEMESAAVAKAVHGRFLKFPCIIQNNPLTFSIVPKSPSSTEEVKKKVDVKSTKPAAKPSDAARKITTTPKPTSGPAKARTTKAQSGSSSATGRATAAHKSAGAVTEKPTATQKATAPTGLAAGSTLPPTVQATATAPTSPPGAAEASPKLETRPASQLASVCNAPPAASDTKGGETKALDDNQHHQPAEPGQDGAGTGIPKALSEGTLPRTDTAPPAESAVSVSPSVDTLERPSSSDEPKQGTEVKQGEVTEAEMEAAVSQSQVAELDSNSNPVPSLPLPVHSSEGETAISALAPAQVPAESGERPTAEAKPEGASGTLGAELVCVSAESDPANPAAVHAPAQDEAALDFPPVTQEILRALEAAVHECRMRSSMKRSDEQAKQGDRKARPPASKGHRGEHSTVGHATRHKSRPASDEEQPPVTHRGGSSGSSSGSRRGRQDGSPAAKRGRGEEETKSKSLSSVRTSSRSSRSNSRAKEEKIQEKRAMEDSAEDMAEDAFPFDLDEFVTVDEVGDDADTAQPEPAQEPHGHSAPSSESSGKRRRTQEPKGRGQKRTSTLLAQKPLKKPTPRAKGRPAKKVPQKVPAQNTRAGAAVAAAADAELQKAAEEELEEGPEHSKKIPEVLAEEPKMAADGQQGVVSEAPPPMNESEVTSDATTASEKELEEPVEAERIEGSSSTSPGAVQTALTSPAALPTEAISAAGEQVVNAPGEGKPEPATQGLRKGMSRGVPTATTLVTLDEVSEGEEDFPEDEEELLMQRGLAEDPGALVTVDEVGADEDPFLQAVKDLQALVTLDEIVEEEDGGSEGLGSEPFPFSLEEESRETFNPEALVTLDETLGDDEGAEEEAGKLVGVETTLPSNTTGTAPSPGAGLEELQKVSFLTVDEVGEEEEEGKAAEEEGPRPTRKGNTAKKRGQPASVRKSLRGKKTPSVKEEEQVEKPLPVQKVTDIEDPEPLMAVMGETGCNGPEDEPSGTVQVQETGDQALKKEPQPTVSVKEECKRQRDEEVKAEPQPKKPRSEALISQEYTMPQFDPSCPIGLEFVVPKAGFFCKLCSLFYGNEDAAKKSHCSSLKHYKSVERYMLKLKTQQQEMNLSQASSSE